MRLLLPFFDDSTAIFAGVMIAHLSARGHAVTAREITGRTGGLSRRQRDLHVGGTAVQQVADLERALAEAPYDAVVVSRASPAIHALLARPDYLSVPDRPCWVSFQPGLEHTPERGVRNRAGFDVVFLTNPSDADLYRRMVPPRPATMPRRHVSWGHPYFCAPETWRLHAPLGPGDIVFFAQAISPKTRRGRMHMLQVMDAIARANPSRRVVIKLRHLPGENANHVHKEVYAYPDLARDMTGGLAPNVQWAAGTMSEALKTAACAITCTSTAAMDAIAAGVPAAVHTSYVENYADPLSASMAAEFEASGIDLPLDDLLHLRLRRPDAAWMAARFRGDDLYDELEDAIERFGCR